MSANNVWVAKEYNGKWYGWDEMAEEHMGDAEDGHVRKLLYQTAIAEADSLRELKTELGKRGYLGYAEYGLTTQPFLPKDGTPIKFVDCPIPAEY